MAAALDALRWVAHWPLDQVQVLRQRFKSWYNPGLQCVELSDMPKRDFVALLARAPGRPPLVPVAIAQQMADTFADNDDTYGINDDDAEVSVLEALCGLAMLCKGSPQEKLYFIFDLFDEHEYGELVEDQVLALCTIAARAASRLGNLVPQASERDVARWVDDLFSKICASSPEQRYARLSRSDFAQWIQSSHILQQPLLLPECVYTFERLTAHLNTSIDNLPRLTAIETKSTIPPSPSPSTTTNQHQDVQDADNEDEDDDLDDEECRRSNPVWIIQGPWVEIRDGNTHTLVAKTSSPNSRLTMSISMLDLPFASELPNLVGYLPRTSSNCVYTRKLRTDANACIAIPMPAHLLPHGARACVTLDSASAHRRQTSFTPGNPSCVLISASSAVSPDLGHETLRPLSMCDVLVKTRPLDSNASLKLSLPRGKIIAMYKQDQVFCKVPLANQSGMVILACPAKGPAHLLSTELRRELTREPCLSSPKLYFVIDCDAPLLGRRGEHGDRDARRINEELLFALAEWQQAEPVSRPIYIVVTNAQPAEAGWGTITQRVQQEAPSKPPATLTQVVLASDYDWTQVAAEPVLETTSLKEAFDYVPNDALSQSLSSLAYFRTDEDHHQALLPSPTFGPALTRLTPSSVDLIIEMDRPCMATITVVGLDNDYAHGHVYDSRLARLQANRPEVITCHGLVPGFRFRIDVAVGHNYHLASCELLAPIDGHASLLELVAINGASSEIGAADALLACGAALPAGAPVLHLGGWIPWEELVTLRTSEQTRAAVRFWLSSRPALASLMQNTCTWVAAPPYKNLHPACAKTLQEYFAPFAPSFMPSENGRPESSTPFYLVTAQDASNVGAALDEVLLQAPAGAAGAIVVALGSAMDKDQREDAAEALVRFAQHAARREITADTITLLHPAPKQAAAWTATVTDHCSHIHFREMCIPPSCLDEHVAMEIDDFGSLPQVYFGFEHRFASESDFRYVRGAPGWGVVDSGALESIPASENVDTVQIAQDLRDVRDRMHQQKAARHSVSQELRTLETNLNDESAVLAEHIQRLKDKRLKLFDERLIEIRELEARKKAYGQVTTLCLDAVESLKQYFQELPQVKAKVPVKQAAEVVREHSLSCDTTQLILRIAKLCQEAHTVLVEGANVLRPTGEIRLKKDGAYDFSEDLTKAAFTRISKLFVRKTEQLEKDDLISQAKFRKLLTRLHDLRGPALVQVGERVDALRTARADRVQSLEDLAQALEAGRVQEEDLLQRLKALQSPNTNQEPHQGAIELTP
ncbi:Hypothetical Protein FCC1311_012482 [Hondaea fermentalgiana]|uniref:Uncharacterized protein n=1 Tax=Hondaea fermentalgiana TaxID=2315210 RepID=A0A2R5GAC8_9STRA|nr:Hypothetical Protein FCC1311_012482 [Hondaea fermentalgiana]|eukprot:GBG25031.1 Hypothetical Protein FCC1311_012482 [Hondaea fermentalgiana]